MKAKTFLILWLIGFLFVAPKWIPSAEVALKVKNGLGHAQILPEAEVPGFASLR